jgi:hypothetical protein
MKLAPDGSQSVFRADSGRTNGNTFDQLGRFLSCEGAGILRQAKSQCSPTGMRASGITARMTLS